MELKPENFPGKVRKDDHNQNNPDWENVTREEHRLLYSFNLFKFIAEEQGVDLKNSKIIELGSGNTVFLDYARKQGLDIIGLDVNPRGVKESPQVIARIEQLPFPDATFDVIYSSFIFDSYVYNQNPDMMAKEILRILKPGGAYISFELRMPITLLADFELWRSGAERGVYAPMAFFRKPLNNVKDGP